MLGAESSTIPHATEDTIRADSVVKTAASHKAQLITAIRLRLRQPINPLMNCEPVTRTAQVCWQTPGDM